MKKVFMVVPMISLLGLSLSSEAATVGNKVDVLGGAGMMALGVEYDRIDERDLEYDGGSFSINAPGIGFSQSGPFLFPGESISGAKTESNRVFAKFAVGVSSNVDLYVKAGAADAKGQFDLNSPPDPVERNEFDSDSDFAWGIGGKACLWGCGGGGPRILADVQYLQYKLDSNVKTNGLDFANFLEQELFALGATTAALSADAETKFQEWHAALIAAWTVNQWRPYLGIKYSDLEIETDLNVSGQVEGVGLTSNIDVNFKAEDNVGAFIGTDYILPNPNLSLNVEGRFFDETAFTVGLTWLF